MQKSVSLVNVQRATASNRTPTPLEKFGRMALAFAASFAACHPDVDATLGTAASAPQVSSSAVAPVTEPTAGTARSAVARPATGSPTTVPCFDDGASDDWLPRTTTVEAGLSGAAIDALIAKASATDSDSLVIIKDGKIVVERTFGHAAGPIETRSVTKSVAALAVLALVADGELASLDEPLSAFFPEFATGDKSRITLRHVLTHASGLAHGLTDADQLNARGDRLRYVRSLPIEHRPGTRFSYSNEASQLLAGIVEQTAGASLDAYVTERIFAPLGIRNAGWARDRSGRVQSYYGLRLAARDLARLGLLLLAEGRAGSRQVLPAHLVREAVGPSATSISYGLMFWRRSNLRQIEGSEAHVAGLGKLSGRLFRSEEDYFAQVADVLGPRARDRVAGVHRGSVRLLQEEPAGDVGFYAVGGLGQRLAVYPRAKLVAVRQHRRRPGDETREARVTWRSFFDEVEASASELAR